MTRQLVNNLTELLQFGSAVSADMNTGREDQRHLR